MNRICVMLSSYNGENYIEQQLQSLYEQKGVEVDIIVRDDGSKDGTLDILRRWEAEGKLKWYAGENLGWAMSFMHLLVNSSEYDYYSFCDQDDIWQEDKLATAVATLQQAQSGPACYFSNLTYWKEGVPQRKVFIPAPYFDRHTCLVQCPCYGCTMVFNKDLADIIKNNPPQKVSAHDFWVFQVANLVGKVYYDDNAYMLYRQHGNNQEGALRSARDIWKRRLTKSLNALSLHPMERNAEQLRTLYGTHMSQETLEIVSGIADYRKTFASYLRLLFSRKYVMQRAQNTFWLKLKVLLRRL